MEEPCADHLMEPIWPTAEPMLRVLTHKDDTEGEEIGLTTTAVNIVI